MLPMRASGLERTGENPRRIVDEQLAQRLGVVCFEAFNDEFDGLVFLLQLSVNN
jgi:hypothetical protein